MTSTTMTTRRVAMVMALATIFVAAPRVSGQDDFYDEKIYDEYVDTELHCSNTSYLPVNDTDPVSWMLPNLTVLWVSEERFIITNNNWTLVIRNATADDLGYYHCLLPVMNGTDYFLVKIGLNAEGPYFEDLWEKYTMNTIIGLSAAGGFAVLCLCLYLLDRFRYREPEGSDAKSARESYADGRYVDVITMGDVKVHNGDVENEVKKRDVSHDNLGFDDTEETKTHL